MKKTQIEKIKKLKTIFLEYEDGSIIAVPEEKTLRIGTAFMKVVGKERFHWEVVTPEKTSLIDRVKNFFNI